MEIIKAIASFLIPTLALLIGFLTYRNNKSNIIVKIQKIRPTALTTLYPSIENDISEYKLDVILSNSGNKDEIICDLIYVYKGNVQKSIPIPIDSPHSKIKAMEQIPLEVEIKRIDLENLVSFGIKTVNNKIKRASKAQIKNYKKVLLEHKRQLSDEWENGVKKGSI